MSIKLLKNPSDLHELQDDLESFCYVMLYLALRYLPHNKVSVLPAIMAKVFEHHYNVPTAVLGGEGKSAMVHDQSYIGPDLEFTNNEPLTTWIQIALIVIKDWYYYLDYLRRRKYALPGTSINSMAHDGGLKLEDRSMRDHHDLDRNFHTALEKTWPSNEKVVDHLPLKGKNFYKKRKQEGADEESTRKKSKSSTSHATPSSPQLSGQRPRRTGLRSGPKLNDERK